MISSPRYFPTSLHFRWISLSFLLCCLKKHVVQLGRLFCTFICWLFNLRLCTTRLWWHLMTRIFTNFFEEGRIFDFLGRRASCFPRVTATTRRKRVAIWPRDGISLCNELDDEFGSVVVFWQLDPHSSTLRLTTTTTTLKCRQRIDRHGIQRRLGLSWVVHDNSLSVIWPPIQNLNSGM